MGKMGVIFLSLLLIAVTIKAQIVRDTDNKFVIRDNRYFLIDKVAWDERGKKIGASHAPQTIDHTCPRVAVMPNDDKSSYYRVPISLSLNKGKYRYYIHQMANISIKYEAGSWPCPDENSLVWTVDDETANQGSDIRFGGKPNNLLTTFKIEAVRGGGYKLSHYNSLTNVTDIVGMRDAPKLGYKRLVLSTYDMPFIFVLQNAEMAFERSSI